MPNDAAQGWNQALAAGADDSIHLVAARTEDLDQLPDDGAIARLDAQPDKVIPVIRAVVEPPRSVQPKSD